MVITRLVGGLGNQLFQYAAGRRLAYARHVPLRLDTRPFETYARQAPGWGMYALGHFKISAEIANAADFDAVGRLWTSTTTLRAAHRLKIFRLGNLVRERTLDFQPEILDLPDQVYLSGYWESEKYFEDIRKILLEEIVPKRPLDRGNEQLARDIGGSHSVAVHIRRGDRARNKEIAAIYGIVPVSYYEAAVKIFEEKFPDARFFIFSDDPQWVKDNLRLSQPHTYVEGNRGENAYIDLYLMSLCRHNIIPNSTFSWWGAWLNGNPQKMVVAPRKWFSSREFREKDRYPAGWIKL